MSEQRFTIQKASGMYLHLPIFDNSVEMADGDVCILLNEQQDTIRRLQDLCGESDSENAKLRIENKKLQEEIKLLKPTNVEQYEQIVQLQEENEQLKKEKEGWKLSTCQYMNKDSVLMMDCQIVHEALFELERLIEADTEQKKKFNDLKDKFKSLVNHYLGGVR